MVDSKNNSAAKQGKKALRRRRGGASSDDDEQIRAADVSLTSQSSEEMLSENTEEIPMVEDAGCSDEDQDDEDAEPKITHDGQLDESVEKPRTFDAW